MFIFIHYRAIHVYVSFISTIQYIGHLKILPLYYNQAVAHVISLTSCFFGISFLFDAEPPTPPPHDVTGIL